MHLFGEIDRLKPSRKRTLEIASERRFTPGHTLLEFGRCACIAIASCNRQTSIAFDDLKEFVAALIAKYLAHQRPEHMHVIAQRCMLGRKLDLGAIHKTKFTPPKEKGRRDRSLRPWSCRNRD